MIKFEEIPHLLEQNGKLLAVARAEWEYMDEMRKVILASEANKFQGSEALKDRMARTTEVYKTHLLGTRQAREKHLIYQATHEALQARFEWYRSQNANKRAEMGM